MSASGEENEKSLDLNVPVLSPDAPAFIPGGESRKQKKIRTCPRKRRRNKKKENGDYLDFDTSDLLERSSQGSNASSTPSGSGRRNRERGDKSYVPLYHFAQLSSANLSNMGADTAGDWLTGLMGSGGGGQSRFRSGSNASDLSVSANRSSLEWLDMQTEWSLSKQLASSGGATGTVTTGAGAGTGTGGTGEVSLSPGKGRAGGHMVGSGTTPTSISLSNSSSSSSSSSHSNSSDRGSGISGNNSGSGSGSSSAQDEAVERKRWSEWAIR